MTHQLYISTTPSLLFGLIFLGAGNRDDAFDNNFNSHFGAVTFLLISAMFGPAEAAMLAFPFERPMFMREYATGTCALQHVTLLCFAILRCAILCHTMLYYTMSCYTMLYYVMLCYTILYYTILYYTILSYYAKLCCAKLYFVMLCYTMLYHILLYYTMLCYAMARHDGSTTKMNSISIVYAPFAFVSSVMLILHCDQFIHSQIALRHIS